MAETGSKIFDLDALVAIADDDVIVEVDVSDTTDSTDGTNKKSTIASLATKLFTSPVINGGDALTADSTELNLLNNQTVLRKQTLYGSSLGVAMSAGATEYVGTYRQTSSAYIPAIQVCSAGTLSNLKVYLSATPGADKTYVGTIMVSNTASDLVATVTAGSNSATDDSHSVSVTAGQFICLRVVTTAGADTNPLQWSVLFTAS